MNDMDPFEEKGIEPAVNAWGVPEAKYPEPDAPLADEAPAPDREAPLTEPEIPAAEPKAPAAEPEAPVAEPEGPAVTEIPAAEPEGPAVTEIPAAEPAVPAAPEIPAAPEDLSKPFFLRAEAPRAGSDIPGFVSAQPGPGQEVPAPQPVYTQPAYTQPANTQPVYAQPANAQPVYAQPVYAQPVYAQPVDPKAAKRAAKAAQKARDAAAGVKKRSPLVPILIGVGGVIALALVLILVILPLFRTPTQKLGRAVGRTFLAAAKTDAIKVGETFTGAKTTLSVDLSKMGDAFGQELPLSVDLTMYTALSQDKAALSLDTRYNGASLLDLQAWFSDSYLAAQSETLLGSKSYGVDLDKMGSRLPDSIFAPTSSSGLYDEFFGGMEGLYEYLTSLKESPIKDLKAFAADALKIAEDGLVVLQKSLDKNAKFSESKDSLEMGEEDVDVNVITLTLDQASLKRITLDLLDWALSSETRTRLNALLKKHTQLAAVFGLDPDDAVDDLCQTLLDVREELKETEDEESDLIPYAVDFYIHARNGQLVGFKYVVSSEVSKEAYTILFGPDMKDCRFVSAASRMEYRFGSESFTYRTSAVITVTENTSKTYSATMKIRGNDNVSTSYNYTLDKVTGDFRFSGEDLTVTGTYTTGPKQYSVSIKKVEFSPSFLAEPVSVKNLGATLTVDGGAKFPGDPSFVEILEMNEENFNALIADISDAFATLMGGFQ